MLTHGRSCVQKASVGDIKTGRKTPGQCRSNWRSSSLPLTRGSIPGRLLWSFLICGMEEWSSDPAVRNCANISLLSCFIVIYIVSSLWVVIHFFSNFVGFWLSDDARRRGFLFHHRLRLFLILWWTSHGITLWVHEGLYRAHHTHEVQVHTVLDLSKGGGLRRWLPPSPLRCLSTPPVLIDPTSLIKNTSKIHCWLPASGFATNQLYWVHNTYVPMVRSDVVWFDDFGCGSKWWPLRAICEVMKRKILQQKVTPVIDERSLKLLVQFGSGIFLRTNPNKEIAKKNKYLSFFFYTSQRNFEKI